MRGKSEEKKGKGKEQKVRRKEWKTSPNHRPSSVRFILKRCMFEVDDDQRERRKERN